MSGDVTKNLPDGVLGEILTELRDIRTEISGLREDQAQTNDRLTAVEATIGQRQLDTKLIWERALAEISETRRDLEKVATEFKTDLREVKRYVRGLNDSLLHVVGELRDMDDRLARLESQNGTGKPS